MDEKTTEEIQKKRWSLILKSSKTVRQNYFALLFLLSVPCLAFSQSDISVGKKYTIKSEVFNEDREVWIGLPNYYDPSHQPTKAKLAILKGETIKK